MNNAQLKAWEAAQALPISVDLVAAATEELRMLEEVDRFQCYYEGPAVVRAIDRYLDSCSAIIDGATVI